MSDRLGKLEQELAAMRPRPLSGLVVEEIDRALLRRARHWSDWCLMGAIGSGLAAACVIVGILSIEFMQSTTPGAIADAPTIAQAPPQRAGDSLTLFARANDEWGGVLK